MTVNWSQDLEIGVEKIDRQHRAFFEQRDKFLNACTKLLEEEGDSKTTRDEIDELFYFLTDYFKTHFDDEEELLEEKEYPYYEQHQKRHRKFISEIQEIKYEFLQSEEIDIDLLHNLEEKITDWFVNHIAKEDKKIAEYL
ncbi:bacteriohemerythrin [Halanaerobacter jeridensis]|uniref:Hemerythrin n=1 Tax=Halanaerobacter jeridensis TaxID=706427 RepID=A0A939BQZ2_9FIRM|nr:bacteriohemerythrin [Halanaerobacter jeridensis]MBM7555441.1 hemerythrin [Halanaerobacter jeridensis]